MKRSAEPLLWILFSARGVAAAMLLPILAFLFGVAFPLGWLPLPTPEHVLTLVGHPVTRVAGFVVCLLSLLHWAHRFRQASQRSDQRHLLRRRHRLLAVGRVRPLAVSLVATHPSGGVTDEPLRKSSGAASPCLGRFARS